MFTIKKLVKYLMTIPDQELQVKICVGGTKYNKIKIALIGKSDDWKSKKEIEWEAGSL